MAFAIRNLSVLAYANGFTLWHYKGGADTLAAIGAAGFLDAAGGMMSAGDMVMVSAADGARVLHVAEAGATVTTDTLG